MTVPDPMAARASLEIARVAFESMTAASDPTGTLAADVSRASSVGRVEPLSMAVRAQGAWSAARQVLQQLTARADLDGQPLVAEARRLQQLSLDDAHALVAMHSWTERALAPGSAAHSVTMPPTSAEQAVAAGALAALERSVGASMGASMGASAAASPFAPPSIPLQPTAPLIAAPASSVPDAVPTASWNPRQQPAQPIVAPAYGAGTAYAGGQQGRAQIPQQPTFSPAPALPHHDASTNSAADSSSDLTSRKSRSTLLIAIGVILVVISAGAVGWYALSGSNNASPASSYNDGVAAYQGGALEIARQSFARAAQEKPTDVNPLIYLARIARETGDVAQSRRFLDNAIRIAPENALALREMGSALLADNQPELARRFYVHALEIDPNDKLAQGFLGCALVRLRRVEEAQRWLTRAGPGDWMRCAATLPPSP